jgi:hypothetical protein
MGKLYIDSIVMRAIKWVVVFMILNRYCSREPTNWGDFWMVLAAILVGVLEERVARMRSE